MQRRRGSGLRTAKVLTLGVLPKPSNEEKHHVFRRQSKPKGRSPNKVPPPGNIAGQNRSERSRSRTPLVVPFVRRSRLTGPPQTAPRVYIDPALGVSAYKSSEVPNDESPNRSLSRSCLRYSREIAGFMNIMGSSTGAGGERTFSGGGRALPLYRRLGTPSAGSVGGSSSSGEALLSSSSSVSVSRMSWVEGTSTWTRSSAMILPLRSARRCECFGRVGREGVAKL